MAFRITERPVEIDIRGSRVSLGRTTGGVLSLTGRDDFDFARGLGFAHGHDRMMQMMLVRLVGQGRLTEQLKDDDDTLAVDVFMRRLGFARFAAAEVADLSGEARAFLDAYCEGVNACLDRHGGPFEFRLTGYRPEPWRPEDCLLTVKLMSYVGLAQTQQDAEKFIVQAIQAGVDLGKLRRLFAPHLDGLTDELAEIVRSVRVAEPVLPPEVRFLAPLASVAASNNWVVAGRRTESGAPFLCCDPHLEVNRLPPVWYEVVARLDGDYRIGITMPGVPGLVMGRTRSVAASFTYGFMDMIDYFVEEVHEGRVRRGDGYEPLGRRTETIRRKKNPPVDVTVYETPRGSLEIDAAGAAGDVPPDGRYLCRAWTGERTGAAGTVEALFRLPSAGNVAEARAALDGLCVSANWLLADRDGAIGYQQTGLLPLRRHSGLHPVPGWDEKWDWRGIAPYERLAAVDEPDSGFLCTANDDWNQGAEPPVVNLHMGPYRADRIAQLLAAKAPVTVDDMKAIQGDLRSLQAERFMAVLGPLLPDGPAAALLRGWDLCYDTGSRAATLFERLYAGLLDEVLGRRLFGGEAWRALVERTNLLVVYHNVFDRVLLEGDADWFGDEGREGLFRRIAAEVLAGVDPAAVPTWGAGRRVLMKNLFFDGRLPRFLGFDAGPIELPGGRATVVQGQIYETAGRRSSFAPSWRAVTDLATDEVHTALPGGPSDRRFSPHYRTDLERWRRFGYKLLRAG